MNCQGTGEIGSRVRYIENLDLTNLRKQKKQNVEEWFSFVVWRRATQPFGIGTITVNNICALMSVWCYSTLYRSVYSYSILFLKQGGQISVEVTGKQANYKTLWKKGLSTTQ